jgi:MFS family permease
MWLEGSLDEQGMSAMLTLARTTPRTAQPLRSDSGEASASLRSAIGLNAANFFIAELGGVVMPFLNDFLKGRQWRYDAIGVASALAGLGVLLMQAPAGFLVDRVRQRRAMLAGASLLLGLCYGLLPLVPATWWLVDPILMIAGMGNAFFAPLLGAMALGLVGYRHLSKTVGVNQSWNHAGNIAAALSAMALVSWFSTSAVFYAVTLVSILAAASVLLIRPAELDETRASGVTDDVGVRLHAVSMSELFRDSRIVVLFVATALFHLANAPVMPLVALYVKELHGTDQQVAAVVLVAQLTMIPVALVTGWLCERWGRKPIFAVGFLVLPLRIFLYSLARSPHALVAIQALDGIGAGIYGVAIVAMCADLTKGKGRFNALIGLIATALAIGGVVGPLASGIIVQHLGFAAAFYVFAAIAAVAASLFVAAMPETRSASASGMDATMRRSRKLDVAVDQLHVRPEVHCE